MKFSGNSSTSRDYSKYIKRLQQLSSTPVAKVSGIISLTIFSVAFFGIFAIMPTFKTIASLSKEIEDNESINQKLSIKIKSLSEAEDIYSKVSKDLLLINKVLPEMAEFERLAWQIEWLASSIPVEITAANFGEFNLVGAESIEDGLGKISGEVTILGSYTQLKKFVKEFSKIDRLITIKEVRITNKSLKQKGGGVSANIQFEAYYLPKELETVKVKI
jgi:Tfp pilus assembly protein PilO